MSNSQLVLSPASPHRRLKILDRRSRQRLKLNLILIRTCMPGLGARLSYNLNACSANVNYNHANPNANPHPHRSAARRARASTLLKAYSKLASAQFGGQTSRSASTTSSNFKDALEHLLEDAAWGLPHAAVTTNHEQQANLEPCTPALTCCSHLLTLSEAPVQKPADSL